MKKTVLILLLSVLVMSQAIGDEGMWLPSLIQKLNINEMQQMGCELSAEEIFDINNSSLKDAVVALDRGSCTAELISEKGLLLTNHHCGFGEIQQHSSVENDYLKNGFWAKSLDEELSNPGKTASFLIRMEDVTENVMEGITDDLSFEEKNEKIREISNKLSEEAEKDTHYEVRVQSFFNSNKYYLLVYEVFKDIRLVGAPPKSIGKFGGDTDNWMWPRHTGDFSIFRIYTGPDGKPAEYSADNIPLIPKHFLPISLKGVNEGDFSMILGYPGSTNRYKTSIGVDYTMQVTNPVRVKVRGQKLDILKKYMGSSAKARIQYSSKYARSSNYYKYSIGQNKGLKNLNVIAQKKAIEDEFINWVNSSNERKEKYGKALDLIKQGYSELEDDIAREYIVESLVRGPELFMMAYRAKVLSRFLEDPKKNKGKIELTTERMLESLDGYYKDYDAATDQKVAAALMKLYADNVNPKYHPSFFKEVNSKYKGDFDKFAAKMYEKTVFDDRAKFEAFLKNPNSKALNKDMGFQAAVSVFDKYGDISDLARKTDPLLDEGRQLFVAGLMEMKHGKKLYPDANSTMRITYGQVFDYEPRDGVSYDYFTTLKGYMEKEIPGDDEFDVPAKLKELYLAKDYGKYADKDGSLHTCFISNNDITGGNSGSPVINGKGELIGIAFDGNWEAMSGDIAFETELQRCINVDIRFVLWTIDKYAGASHLIDEMKIVM